MSWKDQFPKENRFFETDRGILYCGDCSVLLSKFPRDSIGLVITDPPYAKEYLYTYDYLADLVPPLMVKGASLLTIVGHYALPDVLKKFDRKLKFRWILCLNQFRGSYARMAMGILVMWKPILWFVKGSFPRSAGYLGDMVHLNDCDGMKKQYHRWQQSLRWAEYFLENLYVNNDIIVLDPFLGSGTTAIACERLNRRWVGIEIEEKYCEVAKQRLLEIL